MRCRRGEGATGCACRRVLMIGVVLPHATPTGAWRMWGCAWSHILGWRRIRRDVLTCGARRCLVLCSHSVDVEEKNRSACFEPITSELSHGLCKKGTTLCGLIVLPVLCLVGCSQSPRNVSLSELGCGQRRGTSVRRSVCL